MAAASDTLVYYRKQAEHLLNEELRNLQVKWHKQCFSDIATLLGCQEPQDQSHAF